jgi:hypothetical protein
MVCQKEAGFTNNLILRENINQFHAWSALQGTPFVWFIIHSEYYEVYGISCAGYGNALDLFFFISFRIDGFFLREDDDRQGGETDQIRQGAGFDEKESADD